VLATASWLDQVERTEAGHWRVASDLNWRRLKYWRRLVSQALDPAVGADGSSLREVSLEHGPHAVVQGYELTSWLAQRLGWQLRTGKVTGGVTTTWSFTTKTGEAVAHVKRLPEGPPSILRMRFVGALAGKPAAMVLAAEDSVRMSITLEGVDAAARTILVPPQTPADLVGRQLSDRERDPVFRQSMALAQKLAQSVIK
jgi:glucose-6-phosphate dehydrogenase assembly protein OpcA